MDTHGYVYAFAHQPNGWIKVGVTEKNDEQLCWDRINHYIKQHRLPDDGWEFVGFVPAYEARELETRIHRTLKKFRVPVGRHRELFKCSVAVYLITLNGLNEFVDQSQSLQDRAAPRERQELRIACEALCAGGIGPNEESHR
jgi:hypothetical protein